MRFVMILWLVGILVAWLFVSWRTTTLANIPDSVLAIAGIFITGKAVQKQIEKPKGCKDEANNVQG